MSVALLAVALVSGACAARGATKGAGSDGAAAAVTSTTAVKVDTKFGDMASPCGHSVDGHTISLDPAESGSGVDKLYLGVANERNATLEPGLLEDLWDTSNAFAAWCNQQGGIGGLKIQDVDLDGQLFAVEAAMTKACSSVFAMVGGEFAQDNLVFTGKDGSDFHKCKMISFPAFAVSTDWADANGVVQPVPTHGYVKDDSWLKWLQTTYPDQVKKTASVYPEGVQSVERNAYQVKAEMAKAGGFGYVGDVTYNVMNQDFSITAQKLIDEGATSFNYVGTADGLAQLMSNLKIKDYKGIAWADTAMYDQKIFSKGAAAADGVLVREVIHPFEEADKWPATKQYIDIVKQYGPAGSEPTALGAESFSANLLFARAVDDCAKANNDKVTRACVVQAAAKVTSWTGGGMHAPYDLSGQSTEFCSMWLQVKNGKFVRVYPKLGTKDEAVDGLHCDPQGLVKIQGDFGTANVDPSLGY
jgi:ABC-type branched-subunit amino acid transport system substrate-binding protein